MSNHFHKTFLFSSSALALYTVYKHYLYKGENKHLVSTEHYTPVPYTPLPSRSEQLKALKTVREYDILIIGGGVIGAGIALDSISRGLKTALVELDDFSSGTSSRSTKLIHGGVRYLQKAIMHLDVEQYRMVKDALHERANLLAIAPHLSYPLPIMLPVYKWWQVPYFWVGIKMYDFVAGKQVLKSSYFLSYDKVLDLFPLLKKDKLYGAFVYYDGQHNDARMNLSILMTAARMGANIANHVAAVKILKSVDTDDKEKICGARVKDMLTGTEWDIHAKSVINATGPFTDSIRRMDDGKCPLICQPSSGVHIVLPEYYCPKNMGFLDPSTSDGRVLFFLPWQKMAIAGTTDRPCELTFHPSPSEEEVEFILNTIKNYLNPEIIVHRSDVRSAWCGIRPLISDPNKSSTNELARNHVICISDSNLITITGGKWTTYRIMAKDAVDAAVKICNLQPKSECQTEDLLLEGAKGWTPNMYVKLVQDYGMEVEVAQHLANTYGDQAFAVAKLASIIGEKWPIIGQRLHENFPYIKAEVYYAINEYACTAIDVIARRLRLAFLDVEAAEDVLPGVISIMADILKWSEVRQKEEYEKAKKFLLEEMGGNIKQKVVTLYNLPEEEINLLTKTFDSIDTNKKGYIILSDLKMHLATQGENVDDETVPSILNEANLSKSEQIKLEDYLRIMSAIKYGTVSQLMTTKENDIKSANSVDRSGGGI